MGLRPDSLEMFRAHGPDFYDFYKAQVNRDKNGSRRALLFLLYFCGITASSRLNFLKVVNYKLGFLSMTLNTFICHA